MKISESLSFEVKFTYRVALKDPRRGPRAGARSRVRLRIALLAALLEVASPGGEEALCAGLRAAQRVLAPTTVAGAYTDDRCQAPFCSMATPRPRTSWCVRRLRCCAGSPAVTDASCW